MKDFVNFDIANKLKEKGFKEQCLAYYTKDSCFYYNTSYGSDVENAFKSFNSRPNHICGKRIDAPTISQVLKWLREEKKLYVGVTYSPKIEGSQDFFYATIQYIGDYKKTIYPNDSYDNWEGAALNGIEYAIDNNLIL